jgi:hypothetical protein
MASTEATMIPPVQDAVIIPDKAIPEPASFHTGFVRKVKFILNKNVQRVR